MSHVVPGPGHSTPPPDLDPDDLELRCIAADGPWAICGILCHRAEGAWVHQKAPAAPHRPEVPEVWGA